MSANIEDALLKYNIYSKDDEIKLTIMRAIPKLILLNLDKEKS
jgi:hypothetical protein